MNKPVFLLTVSFLALMLQPAFAYASSQNVFGQVLAAGEAEVTASGRDWARFESFPAAPESRYRTIKGRLTFMLKDGTRMELGDNSEMVLRGSVGKYTAELIKGKIGISIPGNSSAKVTTPDSLQVLVAEKESIAGVYYDGKNSRVVTVAGSLKIIRNDSVLMNLAPGNVFIMNENGNSKVSPVAQDVLEGSAQEGTAAPAIGATKLGLLDILITAGLVAGGVVAGVTQRGGNNSGNQASPVLP